MAKSKILIVEDEWVIATDLSDRLSAMGYQVGPIADTGAKALELAHEERPDLTIMDIQLRGVMDGVQAAALIRERFGIPVLFLSAFSDDQVLERVKQTEPFGYLIKPFRDRELKINIEIALYRRHMEQQRDQLTEDLQRDLSQVKQLSGLLPICSACKKIRDDQGQWIQIESYICKHSEADFSHSICPECSRRLYPGFQPGQGNERK